MFLDYQLTPLAHADARASNFHYNVISFRTEQSPEIYMRPKFLRLASKSLVSKNFVSSAYASTCDVTIANLRDFLKFVFPAFLREFR